MMCAKLLSRQMILLRDWYLEPYCSISELSRQSGIDRTTICTYREKFRAIEKKNPERLKTVTYFRTKKRVRPPSKNYTELMATLPALLENSAHMRNRPVNIWRDYCKLYPQGYSYAGFKRLYREWVTVNHVCLYAHRRVKFIPDADRLVLEQWRRSNQHQWWQKSAVITGSEAKIPLDRLCAKVETWRQTALKWIGLYNAQGLKGLEVKKAIPNAAISEEKQAKKEKLMRLIHETPKQYGYNRPAWKLEDLSACYLEVYGQPLGMTSIRNYLKESGFAFKKAKILLTSPDPKFREKVDKIKAILSQLITEEKFFFIDEFGPFAITMKPGWSFTKEIRSVPQIQKSKGWSICTAALEISTNQVSHFYSKKKNAEEMIKLLELLIKEYADAKKLYISGDAASWHESLALKAFVNEANKKRFLPAIELVWLPSSAQFLNVIESVFSGLCKNVIHNSDYESVEECQAAIDRYFEERNAHFKKDPKRAGSQIWGDELVRPVFDESQNCKSLKANQWLVDRP